MPIEDLTPILSRLDSSRAALLEISQAVPENRWREAPRAEAWSAGEVIAHLTMVESRVVEGARKIVAAPPAATPVWKRAHLPVWLAEWRGFRVKTPVPLDKSLVGDKQPMLENLAALRLRTLEFLEENRSRDLSLYRFPHQFFGSLNVYDWFRMIAHHEARHTRQVREIVELFQR
jgi:hypothetical protein